MNAGEGFESIFNDAYMGRLETLVKKLEDPSWLQKTDRSLRLMLHWAALGGHEKIVAELLKRGQSVDARDDTDYTPLILAASGGRLEVVKLMLENGANVDAQNQQGHSSLQYASSKGFLPIIQVLLEAGANVNVADNRNATPLHRAASVSPAIIVETLLKVPGINVNAADTHGNTPLHLACEEGRVEIAKMLVAHAADKAVVNKDKKSPLDLLPNYARTHFGH